MNDRIYLKQHFLASLLSLATTDGINASGKEEIYGCIFGRDSAITVLKILRSLTRDSVTADERMLLLSICKRSLLTLCSLQGKKTNLESGEQPGKFIHEYRKDKFDHLLALEKPWYVYDDGILRNYDSIDATPLALIAIYNYWMQTHDGEFLLKTLPSVEQGLNWIISYGDMDKDFLVEYDLPQERKFGGLKVQSWTDSHESLQTVNQTMPEYPIAPVEVQGYAWLALRMWADYYNSSAQDYSNTLNFSQKLLTRSQEIKKSFNDQFIIESEGYYYASQALDGYKNQIQTVTGNPMLLLWATYQGGAQIECILNEEFLDNFVKRAFMNDLFDPTAGIRTMSSLAPTFDSSSNSYHNGSFWPKLNGMVHEGLLNWNYKDEAEQLKEASIKPLEYFKTPIELYVKDENGTLVEWVNSQTGQKSCREQAWSAAVGLDLLSE